MRVSTYSYRYAEQILNVPRLLAYKRQIIRNLHETDLPRLPDGTYRLTPLGRVMQDSAQLDLNANFSQRFLKQGWQWRSPVTLEHEALIASAFERGPIQLDFLFGPRESWHKSIFRFQASYWEHQTDVGVLVVPTRKFAKRLRPGTVDYEGIIQGLPHARMVIAIPIWVVGVEFGQVRIGKN